jgi:hypothetical protein
MDQLVCNVLLRVPNLAGCILCEAEIDIPNL